MRLHNTLTGAIEEFVPLEAGKVGIYVCGVTPYAESHVGHAMNAIVYDVLVRYLRWAGNPSGGLEVTFVSNYTDVDDKLIDRAREMDIDPRDAGRAEHRAVGGRAAPPQPHLPRRAPARHDAHRVDHRADAAADRQRPRLRDRRGRRLLPRALGRGLRQALASQHRGPAQRHALRVDDDKEFPLDFALWKGDEARRAVVAVAVGAPAGPAGTSSAPRCRSSYLGDTLRHPRRRRRPRLPAPRERDRAVGVGDGQAVRAHLDAQRPRPARRREDVEVDRQRASACARRSSAGRPTRCACSSSSSHYRSPNNLTDEAMTAAERGVERLLGALRPAGRARLRPRSTAPRSARASSRRWRTTSTRRRRSRRYSTSCARSTVAATPART